MKDKTPLKAHHQTSASLTDLLLSAPVEQKDVPNLFYKVGTFACLVWICRQKLFLSKITWCEWVNQAKAIFLDNDKEKPVTIHESLFSTS